MRKLISLILSLLIVISAVSPGMIVSSAYTERASDAYAVIFSASDFQSDSCYANFSNMMQAAQADGITETPDGFLFGGDYTAGSEDPSVQVPKVIDAVQGIYADYPEDNMIFVQGNHDAANSVLTNTGFHEFEDFVVYSINEDDFSAGQKSKTGYDETVKALAESVGASLDKLKNSGDIRPVFVITHVPLHHSSRSSYGDNLYSKYLFDVLNEYGQYLDIIFLFGHNHSGTFDDYIGGAVNYIAKGEEIRIPVPDTAEMGADGYTEETLNFTYMNYGYVGYSSNSENATSTKTLTMGAFELCPLTIEISRYSTTGVYTTEMIERINPVTTDPYVRISGEEEGTQGNSGVIYGTVANIEGATYSWKSSDDSVVRVLGAGKNAQVIYMGEGTADVTLTVTGTDGKSFSDTVTVTVTGDSEGYSPEAFLMRGKTDVDGRKLKFYEISYGDSFMLDGSFTGFADNIDNVTVTWTSSDTSVATVENGCVTFVSSGESTISYVITDGTTTISKFVNILISRAAKPVDTYVLTSTFQPGKSYLVADKNVAGAGHIMCPPSIVTGGTTYNIRMTSVGVTIKDINGTPSIVNTDDSVVWNAVNDGNGNIYLVNEYYGTYLYLNNDATGTLDLGVTTDKTENGTVWHMNSAGFLVSNDDYGIQYSSDNNFRGCKEASIDEQFIYEKQTTEPEVAIRCGSEYVDGVTKVIYSVNDAMTQTIKGTYVNFGEDATVQWISSDENVATVDENGVVSFKGTVGITDITYLVTDADGNSESATVTFDARLTKKAMRSFKYTTTVEAGKKYVAVSTNNVGAAYLMLGTHNTGLYLSRQYTVIQPDTSDDNVYVELELDDFSPVWTAESTDVDGYYYFKNDKDGKYLWAGTAEGAVLTDENLTAHDEGLYKWVYDGATLYNLQQNADTAAFTGIKLSGNGYFRITKTEDADNIENSVLYLFEETELIPYVHIRSQYVSVEDTILERYNVAPFQSEELLPRTVHFPNETFVTYEWTSSNPDVADIDENGVVTYTGNYGETVITLVATSTIPDEDGTYPVATSEVTLKVYEPALFKKNDFVITDSFVPGGFYLIAPSNTVGSSVIMTDEQINTSSSETRLGSMSCVIEDNSGLSVISNANELAIWECIESDTEGYYYLKNVSTGEYLALVTDNNISPYRQVTTTANLDDGYKHDAYLIIRNAANGYISSKQTLSYINSAGNKDSNSLKVSSNQFRMSADPRAMYIYERVTEESITPGIKIKVSTILGPEDITNTLQNRYNIRKGDTEQLLRYTENFAGIISTVWSVSDESIATIDENGLLTYTGKEGFVTVTLTVTGTDSDGEAVTHTVRATINVSADDYESPSEDYPEYPHEGSVRINKTASNSAGGYNFQDSGVTEVELSVTGVPLPQPVDVVVVFDHSSSMNSGGRLQNAIEDTREFALQVVNANRSNRIAVVTFDRYYNNYKSITEATANYSTSGSEDRIITGDGTAAGAFMTLDESEALIDQIDTLAYNSIAGTNYDFGLQKAYEILKTAKSDPNANKMQYVIFMSDGEPFVYNNVKIEYGTKDPDGVYAAWLRGDNTNSVLADYMADSATYPAAQFFNPRGDNWFSEIIKTAEGGTLSDMPQLDYYTNYREGLGATLFTIGYGAGEPGTLTRDVLATMASTEDNFYYAEGDLQAAYDSILQKIVYAANEAVVTDKMGENFNLQFAASYSLGNDMADITLDPAPFIEVGSWTLNSDGTRNEYTVLETITFRTNENGDLTEAYSTACDGNIYDVAASTINGKYVSYSLLDEVFSWNIGDITRDEITLRYYAYLEGSAEGEREAGVYDTNEFANIDYINYRGTVCQQTFPVPSLGWKQAAVNYEFYIVNEKGEPVNRNGIVVPFAERVLIGQEQTKDILLNSAGEYTAYTLVANEELPDGYVLFNENTSYQIAVSSGDNPSMAIINDDMDIKTTYFRDGTIIVSGNGLVEGVVDYTNTHVSFAVLYTKGIVPDTVVIDYGLPVKINVLANDFSITSGEITAIGTAFKSEIGLNNTAFEESMFTDGVTDGLQLENGVASIDGNVVVFTPSNLTMDSENVFYYECKAEGKFYYSKITVIPAANIYYEESFFTFTDGNGYVWKTAGETFEDKYQAEDRPGNFSFADVDANFVYGYDSAYSDSCTYSLGSAKYTSVDSNSFGKEPLAEFTFCGTGFDLFSVTNVDTGAVLVTVYKTDGKLYKNFIVNTYYGYVYDSEAGKYVPDLTSEECLYQVPVISARNLGYDTYRVVIKPMYSSLFDMAYNKESATNSYDIYIDSVRIYDPAGLDVQEDTLIGDAYIEDGEFSPSYCEIRRNILDAKSFYAGVETLPEDARINGAIFIDGNSSLDENGISDLYLEHGPNNELYLAKGQAVAFHVSSDSPLTFSSLQLGMKVVSGSKAEVVIMNTSDLAPRTISVEGATESYRRLNSAIVWEQEALANELDETSTYKTKYPIVILNNSDDDTIVSLTQFKWAYTSAPESGTESFAVALTAATPMMAYAAVRRVQADSSDDGLTESFPYTDEDIEIAWSDTVLTEGATATLKITTPADIIRVTVDGADVTECEIDDKGNKLWTYSFAVEQVGENSYNVLLFDNDGNVSNVIPTDSITVEEKPSTDEPSAQSIFEIIFNWIKRIITFFRRVFA